MTSATQWQSDIVPAQLSYLAIYNPSLGPTDETFDKQLVFYFSRATNEARAAQRKNGKTEPLPDNSNEQLRQIGLAQGLVDFARTFSDGEPVQYVDTEKSRIVLHQLEAGWWLLASIDLTRIPASTATTTATKPSKHKVEPEPRHEFSAREVSPPALLISQIQQAQQIFALHHGFSLTNLHSRLARDRFCSILERFWTRFARSWVVLLHGNPAVDVLAGIKLSSGGELGFGAGEETWGSGERCVLEEFVHQTEGLVDIVAARYGEPATPEFKTETLPWIGAGDYPSVNDGIIFGGVGGITRSSLQSISLWMRHIYTYGEYAYGVRDNPSRERRKRRRKTQDKPTRPPEPQHRRSSSQSVQQTKSDPVDLSFMPRDTRPQMHDRIASQDYAPQHPGIPPPIVSAAENALKKATERAEQSKTETADDTTLGIPDQYVKYLTLGLSTLVKPAKVQSQPPDRAADSGDRSFVKEHARTPDAVDTTMSMLDPIPDGDIVHARIARQKYQEDKGHYIIGLNGDLDKISDEEEAELTEGSLPDNSGDVRMVLRTVHVCAIPKSTVNDDDSDETLDASPTPKPTRLRVLVYVHRPFMYCFLFEPRTESLSYASFYKNIHHNLLPIHKPLLSSTKASNVAERIVDANADDQSLRGADTDVYDLLYDPLRMTIHATVPNIPDPGSLAAEGILSNVHNHGVTNWTRLDALSVHSAILNTLESTQRHKGDLERTSRTSRNWWIVWMKLPASDKSLNMTESAVSTTQAQEDPKSRIAVVVRKASDSQPIKPSTSSRAASGLWSSLALMSKTENSSSDKVIGLNSGGIGFDARRYIEGLLSLNR